MTIKAILWDIGGVLVRTMDRTPRTHLAERLGVTYEQLEEMVLGGEMGAKAQRGEITEAEKWRHAARSLGVPDDGIPGFQQEFFGGDRLDGALVDVIRGLHADYRTGIISNALSDTRRVLVDTWRIVDAFDVIILSAEVGVMKPEPRIYHLALQSLSVEPQEAVFIDDFERNVQGAQNVGLHAIHFRTPQQALEELSVLRNS